MSCFFALQKIFSRSRGLWTKQCSPYAPLVRSTGKHMLTTTTSKRSSIIEDFNSIINSEKSCNQVAVIQDDFEISYDELNFNVNNLCLKLMNEYKLGKGDSIVHMSEIRIDSIQIQLACIKLGIIHVPIYPQSTKNQFEATMNLLHPSLIISDRKYPNLEEYIANNTRYIGKTIYLGDEFDSNHWLASEFTSENDPLGLHIKTLGVSDDDILTVLFTSGTTGNPKGCVHTHSSMHFNAMCIRSSFPSDKTTDMYLCLVPQHGIGAICQRLLCLCSGQTILFPNKNEFRDAFHWLDLIKNNPNNNIGAIFFGKALSDLYCYSKQDSNNYYNKNNMSHVKQICYGGDFVPLEIVDHLKKHLFTNADFKVGYGMTEVGSLSLVDPLINYDNDQNDVPIGKMLLNPDTDTIATDPNTFFVDIQIADDGEILIDKNSAKGCMTEYYKDKNRTDELIDENNWIHTGDICEIDKNGGFVYFKGRKKDVIVLEEDTRMVLPCDIESVVSKHEYVNQCAVVGYPNNLLRNDNISVGESPCAFIVINIDSVKENEKQRHFDSVLKEIEMLCKENLPPIMQVKKYIFIDALPKTATNKVDKKVLRQRIANGEFQDIAAQTIAK